MAEVKYFSLAILSVVSCAHYQDISPRVLQKFGNYFEVFVGIKKKKKIKKNRFARLDLVSNKCGINFKTHCSCTFRIHANLVKKKNQSKTSSELQSLINRINRFKCIYFILEFR